MYPLKTYNVHGKDVLFDGQPCGIYKTDGLFTGYAEMAPDSLIRLMNSMSPTEAVEQVQKLRDMAAEQLKNGRPSSFAEPILRQIPEPMPFAEAKPGIEGTCRFMDDILKALKGE